MKTFRIAARRFIGFAFALAVFSAQSTRADSTSELARSDEAFLSEFSQRHPEYPLPADAVEKFRQYCDYLVVTRRMAPEALSELREVILLQDMKAPSQSWGEALGSISALTLRSTEVFLTLWTLALAHDALETEDPLNSYQYVLERRLVLLYDSTVPDQRQIEWLVGAYTIACFRAQADGHCLALWRAERYWSVLESPAKEGHIKCDPFEIVREKTLAKYGCALSLTPDSISLSDMVNAGDFSPEETRRLEPRHVIMKNLHLSDKSAVDQKVAQFEKQLSIAGLTSSTRGEKFRPALLRLFANASAGEITSELDKLSLSELTDPAMKVWLSGANLSSGGRLAPDKLRDLELYLALRFEAEKSNPASAQVLQSAMMLALHQAKAGDCEAACRLKGYCAKIDPQLVTKSGDVAAFLREFEACFSECPGD